MNGFGSQPLSFGSQGEPTLDHTDYELLKHALQNEKAAPELLPYEDELVQRVYLQLEHQVRSFINSFGSLSIDNPC